MNGSILFFDHGPDAQDEDIDEDDDDGVATARGPGPADSGASAEKEGEPDPEQQRAWLAEVGLCPVNLSCSLWPVRVGLKELLDTAALVNCVLPARRCREGRGGGRVGAG